MVFAEILGPDLLIVLAIVVVLFGGSQLPKLARSIGSAKSQFEKGLAEGANDANATTSAGDAQDAAGPA